MLSVGQYGGLQTAEIGHIVRGWGDSGNENTDVLVRAIVSGVVARAQERDDRWFILASSELGVSESVLRDYAAHGDSLSLAILIHIIRQQLSLLGNLRWPAGEFSKVLETASKFKVQDTSPELQHNFCALWNRMVLKAKNDQLIAPNILRTIRKIYAALHQGTNASQPPPTKFTTLGNHQDRIQHQSSRITCAVSAPVNCPCDDPHDNSALALSISLDSPSSSVPDPVPVNERHMDVPPLDNEISAPVTIGSFHPAHQTTIESHYVLPTSSDPTTTRGTQGNFSTSTTRMMPQSTPETSTSASPLESRLIVPTKYIPPTPSPIPFLEKSHSPVLATAATRVYLSRPTSAPAAAEGEGSTKVALRKDSDEGVLDPPFAAHPLAGAEASPDRQPHLLPMPPVTALSIAGPSRPSIDAQNSEDLPGCISIPPLP
ncbi:hypothetical protein EDB84DRAFT_1583791 [Lactarius hengduanensis]|nr:hypothetical protein EDB84DRAFT_1583791 [Lactarius hengduanensis]